jgi:uncharacterized BrkB/YihY/UPF0761 family membrane protein
MGLYALIVINIACVILCYYLAKRRKADSTYWALLGALLGPLAVPFVLFSKPIKS